MGEKSEQDVMGGRVGGWVGFLSLMILLLADIKTALGGWVSGWVGGKVGGYSGWDSCLSCFPVS